MNKAKENLGEQMELVVSWCVSVTDGESGELWALDGIPRR